MAYTVLARKYRSQSFDDVVGQDSVAHTLKNAIKTGRVAHAYLFTGTRGVGKTTIARILAKALNCHAGEAPTTEPCCRCESCLAVNTGDDIDVLEIDGASNNGVDQVRELRDNAIYRPARSRYKIYIIDEVHMLSVAAFNALLKILEEPPSHVKFIFATTEPNKVLATIQSRCQRFDFRNISVPDIGKQLKIVLKQEAIDYQEELILALAKLANGSMRDSLSLLDRLISTGVLPLSVELLEESLGLPNVERMYDLVEHIGSADAAETLMGIDQLITSGLTETQIVDALIDCMRDLMVLKTAGHRTELLVLTPDQLKMAERVAEKFDVAGLIYAISALEKLRWSVKNSDSPRTLLEASALRFALSEHFLNIDTLLAQLDNQPAGAVKKKQLPRPHTDPPPRAIASIPANKPAPGQPAPTVPLNAPPAEPPADATAPPAPIAEGDIASIRASWPSILEAINERLGPGTGGLMLKSAPAHLAEGTLTIEFDASAKVQQEMCAASPRSEQLQETLCHCLGRQVQLVFALKKDEGLDTESPDPAADAQTLQTKRRALLNDPAVKTVLLGLNATVTEVKDNEP
ncbi:MAG: DNA polymerase III subunit gamma/tau [Planctomycetes bacterium]|nr:DNA polymerase III subunit gamma/tau [Planctomycetota bacterium]